MSDESSSPDRQIVRSEVLPPARGDSFDMGAADDRNSWAVTSRADSDDVLRIRQDAAELGVPEAEVEKFKDALVGLGTGLSRHVLSRYVGTRLASGLGAVLSDMLVEHLFSPQQAKLVRRQLRRYGQ